MNTKTEVHKPTSLDDLRCEADFYTKVVGVDLSQSRERILSDANWVADRLSHAVRQCTSDPAQALSLITSVFAGMDDLRTRIATLDGKAEIAAKLEQLAKAIEKSQA